MDHDERVNLERIKAGLQKDKTFELENLRADNRRDAELSKVVKRAETLRDLENLKHELQPSQLDNLFFDHERRVRVDHYYQELEKDSEHERKKDLMMHEVECHALKEKLSLKLKQKFGEKQLSESDLNFFTEQMAQALSEED